jgi:hypothetical protein
MKRIKGVLISLGILAICIAVMPATSPAGEQKEKPQTPDAKYVVIGHLQSRDKVVTISLGPNGAVYTIKNKAGKVLEAQIQEKDLQDKYPTIYYQITSGVAGNDATLRPTVADPTRLPFRSR